MAERATENFFKPYLADCMATLISERCWKGQQSWNYEAIVKLYSTRKLRVTIKRDSYDFQCVARVDLWTGEWTRVNSLSISECLCYKVSYVAMNADAVAFRPDAVRLLDVARKIVATG